MRNPLNRPMLAILLAAGVVSLVDGDDPQRRPDVQFAPLVRNGQTLGHKVTRGAPARTPKRARPTPKRPTISPRGSWALPS